MDTAPGSLLIVDDEPMDREMLSRFLQRHGFAITEAQDGEQAVELLRRTSFDLVLLDAVKPGLGGLEVLKIIRQTYAPTDLPLLMATVKDTSLDLVEALQLGANDYLTKPFDFAVVLARIRTQLSLKRSVDEIRRLEQSLEQRNEELEAANRRMKRDLEAAVKIQNALLPSAPPDVSGARFAWSFRPCTELAGDLLNVLPLSNRHVGLYVLDVSGHGVAAALLSVTVSWVLSRLPLSPLLASAGTSSVPAPLSPAVLAGQLDREFPWDPRTEQYFTLLYGVLDRETWEFRFVSAGHPGPVYLAHDAAPAVLKPPPGFAIGLGVGNASYEEYSVCLRPGDRLYLYSDGVVEALNPAHKQFGEERFLNALEQARPLPLQDSLASLVGTIETWCGFVPPHDDISILAVEVAAPVAATPSSAGDGALL
jgi:sigma-B regulation protein RsbU (phosphoserine phosphatase)